VACARLGFVALPSEPPPGPLSDVAVWPLADGVLFSVLSSMVLWSILLTSLYQALS
jgi:hypothetical protein